jgi:site-specific DNA-methyltransferase (adenine-specific)
MIWPDDYLIPDIKPFHQEEAGIIYCGRQEDVLVKLPKTGLMITSPPYNMGVSSGGGFSKFKQNHGHYDPAGGYRKRGDHGKWSGGKLANGYEDHGDVMPWPEYEAWQRQFLTDCWERLTETGAIYYNHKPRPQKSEVWLPTALNPGLPLRQIIIWARAGGINFAPTHYVPTCEWLLLFAKTGFRLRDKGASGAGDVWYIPQESNLDHPAPFPVKLPKTIIETTGAEIIYDPFMGIGSTAVAAKELGRKFIGIEISEKYCAIAVKRLRQNILNFGVGS